MSGRFDAFVIFAEMRTGSNFLEETLNTLPGLKSYGEVFNPGFIGHHRQFQLLGMDLPARDAEPLELLRRMMAEAGALPGFRLFHDHDPRVVDHVLAEERIAKVILTRDPVARYVSWKIVQRTGQWRLTDLKNRKAAKVRFDVAEFQQKAGELAAFQTRLRRRLQETGQTAFSIDYAELAGVGVLTGLVRFLGVSDVVKAPSRTLKKQNPGPIEDLLENPEVLSELQGLAGSGADQAVYEPMPGAGVPSYVAHPTAGLLFQPIPGGPVDEVIQWMAEVDGVGRDALMDRMTQKSLRAWMKETPGFRSFSVLRHPLARAVDVLNRHLLPGDQDGYAQTRNLLRQRYKVPFPTNASDAKDDPDAYHAVLQAFLTVMKGFVAGQTTLRPHSPFSSQSVHLQSMAQVAMPHHIIRETDLLTDPEALARTLGMPQTPAFEARLADSPVPLTEVYSEKLEKAAYAAYRRDYIDFGFGPWRAR